MDKTYTACGEECGATCMLCRLLQKTAQHWGGNDRADAFLAIPQDLELEPN
jgi:hypothetical protein